MKKTNGGPSEIRVLSLLLLALIIVYSCSIYYYHYVYSSIHVVVNKNAAVEYGSANYNINDLIKKVEGEIVSVKTNLDTNVVGEQEVIVEVKKNNIVKEVPILVSIVDTVAPAISLKEEKVTITRGDDYDLTSNIDSIKDAIDGDISYLNEVGDDSTFYYHFDYNSEEIDSDGEHEVTVTAKDKNGNVSSTTFLLEVVAPKVIEPVVPVAPKVSEPVYSNLPANASGSDLVSIAYSLVGSPYVAGANGPNSFDCSGFVQYVYSRVGISVSRSSSTQIHDGVAVSYEDAQPGDILSWGYTEGSPTHSALYVGNGQMVHATNPRQGVIASDVAAWTRGSGTHVIAVRRIQ